MNEGSLGKSVCTAVAAGCESQKDLEDLADLADTYFLGPQQLARELTVSLAHDPLDCKYPLKPAPEAL